MYRLHCFANFSAAENCLVVPVFAVPGQNVYYVQIMNRHFDVIGFSPYYNFDDAQMHYVDSKIVLDRGKKGILGVLFGVDQLFYGNIEEVRSWGKMNESIYRDSPLLRAQLTRLAIAPLGKKYVVFSE